jgi:hypothetical protein|tara:strand:- start:434 stop:568 length:135 start_codon:yes stop_codon:yes gene_type:complete
MMTLAAMNFSEFLGTIWFSSLCALVGWVGGQVFPLSSIIAKFKR